MINHHNGGIMSTNQYINQIDKIVDVFHLLKHPLTRPGRGKIKHRIASGLCPPILSSYRDFPDLFIRGSYSNRRSEYQKTSSAESDG